MTIVQVKCYSSYTYAQEPRSFTWQEKNNRVEGIERAWQEPGKRLFEVITEDGKSFELCYHETNGQWSATELLV
jgi:hypothetical protein